MILVVDEHRVYRSGLREVIESGIAQSRVKEASTIQSADQGAGFDLLLIDMDSLDQRLLALPGAIHEFSPETRVAVMSTSGTRADVFSCLSAGFHGFVDKLQSDRELIAAVSDLLLGRIHVPSWLAGRGCPSVEPPLPINQVRLTRRQHDILPMLAQGMSNKEIARRLNIAEGTAKIHTSALLRALGARNRTKAAFMAAKLVAGSGPTKEVLPEHFPDDRNAQGVQPTGPLPGTPYSRQ